MYLTILFSLSYNENLLNIIALLQKYRHTLQNLKFNQLYHQVYYRLKNRFFKKNYTARPQGIVQFNFKNNIIYSNSYVGSKKFSFLNLEKDFSEIDWNFNGYGKLWTYNLNYFEFLNQKEITKEQGVNLIQNYVSKKEDLKDGLEPYPISLRGINWTKFLSRNSIQDAVINEFLYQDYLRLLDNLEYHLLANHLLENGFSLLFGAYYFQDDKLYEKGKEIVTEQLKEQVLEDGAHYELSPMYHQIILHRVLDSLNLVKNNSWKNGELIEFLQKIAEKMLSWLNSISFKNLEIPKLNDAADGIAPTTRELLDYAAELGVSVKEKRLKDSGYRKFVSGDSEILIDVGQIAPKYQPGHSHADSLQFLLNYKNNPVIVDTGISTYEKNERRQIERSTASHNTITINDQNSSEVWGGFRVAKRAKVTVYKDTSSEVEAQHDGYKNLGLIHKRKFSIKDQFFQVRDEIVSSQHKIQDSKGNLHFHPSASVTLSKNKVIVSNELQIDIEGADHIELVEYDFAAGFNQLVPAMKAVYKFQKEASITISSL